MRITLMTPDQRTELGDSIGRAANPAAPEMVQRVAEQARAAHMYGPTLPKRADCAARILDHTLPVLRRLLALERDYSTTREILARIVAAERAGDAYDLADVVTELDRAGVGIRRDVEEAEHLAAAEAHAGAFQ